MEDGGWKMEDGRTHKAEIGKAESRNESGERINAKLKIRN
jgi:hypothetical protein